jgi:hypothetical protein
MGISEVRKVGAKYESHCDSNCLIVQPKTHGLINNSYYLGVHAKTSTGDCERM